MSEFVELGDGVGIGMPPRGWSPVAQRPLLILVGVTGVGKSTAVGALQAAGLRFDLLPNRRDVTDWVLIPAVQRMRGEPIEPVSDRTRRFALTRRYRERHPGGMAHALSQLCVPAVSDDADWLLFDGLRGENEVRAAAEALPRAWFLCLHAPDAVRVRRLLGRADAFDAVGETGRGATAVGNPSLTNDILTDAQVSALLADVDAGQFSLAQLEATLTIVRAERQNYDPDATLAALERCAPARTLRLDTAVHSPADLAQQIISALTNSQ